MSSILVYFNLFKINGCAFRLKNADVFHLIKKHKLYGAIHDMIVDLMVLDYEQTISLLLDKNQVPSEIVVEKLQNQELQLYRVYYCSFFLQKRHFNLITILVFGCF